VVFGVKLGPSVRGRHRRRPRRFMCSCGQRYEETPARISASSPFSVSWVPRTSSVFVSRGGWGIGPVGGWWCQVGGVIMMVVGGSCCCSTAEEEAAAGAVAQFHSLRISVQENNAKASRPPPPAHKSRYSVATKGRIHPAFSRIFPRFSPDFPPHHPLHVMHLVAAVFELSQLALFALWPRLSPPDKTIQIYFAATPTTPRKRGGRMGGGKRKRFFSTKAKRRPRTWALHGSSGWAGVLPLFYSLSQKTFQPGIISESWARWQGRRRQTDAAKGGIREFGGVAMPKECIVHPKVLIHLPWHNFIHSGFVVELKVWPATGITNYKKIAWGKCWIPGGIIYVSPENRWVNILWNYGLFIVSYKFLSLSFDFKSSTIMRLKTTKILTAPKRIWELWEAIIL